MNSSGARIVIVITTLVTLYSTGQRTISQHQYIQAHQTSTNKAVCISPPPDFDPATASSFTLHLYGLPLPPPGADASELAKWVVRMHHATKRICGNSALGRSHKSLITATTTDNQPIWTGYVVTNGGYNFVQGEWHVPTYYSTSSPSAAFEWVGIGGYKTTNLLQAGSESDAANGYRMWWEDYPKHTTVVYAGPAITAGSDIYVEADYNYNYANASTLFMDNYSNGTYWSLPPDNFAPSSNTADWILERPTSGGCYIYLQDVSQVHFIDAYAAQGATEHGLSAYANTRITMSTSKEGTLAVSSVLDSGGTGFTTTWESKGNNYCP